MDPRERFIAIYRQYIRRPGSEALLNYLQNSDFFVAPASARYHSSVAGGLCQHSLNVYDCLKDYMARPRVMELYGLTGEEFSDESIAIVARLRPNVLFSKGGFVSVPAVFGAACCRVPIVMHESDITPGLANKLCKPFARRICTTFPECAAALGEKGLYTGTPLRASLFGGDRSRGLRLCGFSGERPVLMMMGGSLGAQTVNAVLREALPRLTARFDVLHVCGRGNLDGRLSDMPGYRQFEYLSDELPDAYACADLMLSRAGSNSLSEILALRKPALLIPYHSGRGDQVLNAASLKARGLAHVLPQGEMTADSLCAALEALWSDRDRLQAVLSDLPEADGTQAVLSEIRRYMRPDR